MANEHEHLRRIREHELRLLLPLLPRGARILEVGAGMGWQARALAEHGFEVSAIDLPAPLERVWPVQEYDGKHIPFANAAFDVVFSSNVLEHVPHVLAFQSELQRVLKHNGVALHILPTGAWRFWTNLAYYPHLLRRLLQKFLNNSENTASNAPVASAATRSVLQLILPPRHGELGNFLSEVYWFSRWRWQRLFQQTGWRVASYQSGGLCYSGYELFGLRLAINTRQQLRNFFGSACHVFCLTKQKAE